MQDINEDRLMDLSVALETAARIGSSITISPLKALELSQIIEQYVESYNDLATHVHNLTASNRILREFVSDDKKELTDEDKEVLKGMGINI